MDFLADGFGDELGGDTIMPGLDDLPTTIAAVNDVTLEPVDTKLNELLDKNVLSSDSTVETGM